MLGKPADKADSSRILRKMGLPGLRGLSMRLISLHRAGLRGSSKERESTRTGMTGGFLGQVLRGRARMPRWMSCGRAGETAWIVILLWSVASMAQSAPATSAPAPIVGQSGVSVATPATVQQTPPVANTVAVSAAVNKGDPAATVWQWKGLIVDKIVFEGVTFSATDMLPKELTQKVGVPLDPLDVRASLRRLFVSGRYRDIEVRGVREEIM